jgi:hypothetical protein
MLIIVEHWQCRTSAFHRMYFSLAEYLNDDQNTIPFVLTGPSGAGKSSLMAFAAKKVFHTNFSIH